LRIAFHEWADMFHDVCRAPGWHNKLRYVFGNPGWRHQPSMATTHEAIVVESAGAARAKINPGQDLTARILAGDRAAEEELCNAYRASDSGICCCTHPRS
jgi:hypothetical protein